MNNIKVSSLFGISGNQDNRKAYIFYDHDIKQYRVQITENDCYLPIGKSYNSYQECIIYCEFLNIPQNHIIDY